MKFRAVIGDLRRLIVAVSLVFLYPGISPAGTLTGSAVKMNNGANVNLSAAGPVDWVHWGLQSDTSINRKANVMPQISDLTPVRGSNDTNSGVYIFQLTDNYNSYTWGDGTPTLAINETTTGVWAYGWPPPNLGTGFEITVLADTSVRTLKMYVGAYGARGRFEATLSDGSAPTYIDTSVNNFRNGPNTIYTLQFAANSAGQTLRIRHTLSVNLDPFQQGNVTLHGAALNAQGANSPPSPALTAPANNSKFAASDSITLTATATDLDGEVEKVEFYAGTQKLGQDTTTPFSVSWNSPAVGYYVLTAVAWDDSGNFAVSLPIDVFVHGTGGSLAGAMAVPPAQVNLTTEGTLDWTHWGTVSSNSFDRKAGVAERISNFTPIGSHPVQQYSNNYSAFSWTDGKPTAAVSSTPTGIYMTGHTNGFKLTVPADTLPKRLKVYVGLYGAVGNFQAYLSDMSAPAYTDTSLENVFADSYAVYILDYRAASAGENLIIQYRSKELYDFDYGNVTLQSATLSGQADSNLIPQVRITHPTNNAVFIVGTNVHVEAQASDPDGSVVRVEFFQGSVSLGQDTTTPYSVIWTNPPAGSYTLTAKATDNQGATITSSPVLIDVRTPPPLDVRLQNPRIEGGAFKFDIATQSGRTYTIQRSSSLQPLDWQTFSSFVGDGGTRTITDPQPNSPRFYRATAAQ
jgi:hypothetical protein